MDLANLKEILISGREISTNLGLTLSKFIPFEGSKIAGVLVLLLSFWAVSSVFNLFKANFATKLIGTGALFYLLWLW